MAIKDELREQFNFFRRHSDETKKEYKRRIRARGQELLDGKNSGARFWLCMYFQNEICQRCYVLSIDHSHSTC